MKTKDGGIGYYIDLDDSYFLNSFYDFKNNPPYDNTDIELLLQDLGTTIGLPDGTLSDWNIEHSEDRKRLWMQIKQLLEE